MHAQLYCLVHIPIKASCDALPVGDNVSAET